MKQLILTSFFIFVMTLSFANKPNTRVQSVNQPKITSITYTYDCYEKPYYCVVTCEVNGHTYVGHGEGMSEREACDKAYEAAHNFMR